MQEWAARAKDCSQWTNAVRVRTDALRGCLTRAFSGSLISQRTCHPHCPRYCRHSQYPFIISLHLNTERSICVSLRQSSPPIDNMLGEYPRQIPNMKPNLQTTFMVKVLHCRGSLPGYCSNARLLEFHYHATANIEIALAVRHSATGYRRVSRDSFRRAWQ